MKIKERALALLLSMVMVLTFMPALTFAEGEECEHEMDYVPEVEATCVDKGMEGHWQCGNCGKFFRDSESGAVDTEAFDDETVFETAVDPTNHADGLSYEPGFEATCDSEGEKEHYHCDYCDKDFSDAEGTAELDDITIPRAHGTLVKDNGYAATIVEEGRLESWSCSECGQLFKDAEGTEEASEEDLIIPKKAAPDQETLDQILEEDMQAYSKLEDIWAAIEAAEEALKAGNAAAAANSANQAVTLATSAEKTANDVMAKAKKYISDNEEALTDEDKADVLSYMQWTLDDIATAKAKAGSVLSASIETARQGVYDPSLPKVKAKKAKASKKAFTAKWKKLKKKQLKTGTTNIEVWACADGAFAAGSTIERVVGRKKASTKFKGMPKGTYFVKARAIKYVGGVKYVGPWSAVKKVKVKK